MLPFVYNGLPSRVLFGHGTRRELHIEAQRLGISRALVLSTPNQQNQAEDIAAELKEKYAGTFAHATMHTPVDVTREALIAVEHFQADGIVAVGGGSTTGLGKAIALHTGLPLLAVPTTYAGSEMTPILGQTENGVKTTLRNPKVQPRTVIYDVDLTLALPIDVSMASGLNAMAHAAEALYAPDTNPIIGLMAEEGLRALSNALPRINAISTDPTSRADALYGAWLCGICLGSTTMALHHKLCHTLGGMFDLPHAPMHAVLLPYAIQYNAASTPAACDRIAHAIGRDNAAQGLQMLARRIGLPQSLQALGMPRSGIAPVARQAFANPYSNPARITEPALLDLLEQAWEGLALSNKG